MPIYEFHCAKCARDFELLVPTSKWEGTACPQCGSKKISKKLSVFATAASKTQGAPSCSGNPASCESCEWRHQH